MPLDEKPSELAPGAASEGDEWEGPWGSISPVANSVETLCIQIDNDSGRPRIYYYPYRTVGKWNWAMDAPESLELQIGGIQITVSGIGLRRLAEALNRGQLKLIRSGAEVPVSRDIVVRSILIEDLRD
jgi:hypothetical protein